MPFLGIYWHPFESFIQELSGYCETKAGKGDLRILLCHWVNISWGRRQSGFELSVAFIHLLITHSFHSPDILNIHWTQISKLLLWRRAWRPWLVSCILQSHWPSALEEALIFNMLPPHSVPQPFFRSRSRGDGLGGTYAKIKRLLFQIMKTTQFDPYAQGTESSSFLFFSFLIHSQVLKWIHGLTTSSFFPFSLSIYEYSSLATLLGSLLARIQEGVAKGE